MATVTWELIPWIAGYAMFGAFALEGVVSSLVRRDGHYGLRDTLVNLMIMGGYIGVRIVLGAAIGVVLLAIYRLTPLRWSMAHAWHWVILFVLNDFLYSWSHRASHAFRFMWASHAVHHSSTRLNLSIGLRNSWVGGVIDWVFFVPPVALGFPPLALGVVIAIGSAWDFLTHTPYIGKLPGLDAVFNTPSNHRVHHAKNPQYIDKNCGGTLIVRDRLFGTYAPEVEPPEYGTLVPPRRPYNPFYLELYLWAEMIRDAFRRRPTETRETSA